MEGTLTPQSLCLLECKLTKFPGSVRLHQMYWTRMDVFVGRPGSPVSKVVAGFADHSEQESTERLRCALFPEHGDIFPNAEYHLLLCSVI